MLPTEHNLPLMGILYVEIGLLEHKQPGWKFDFSDVIRLSESPNRNGMFIVCMSEFLKEVIVLDVSVKGDIQ